MTSGRLSRTDWLAASVLCAATMTVFGFGAARLGFYYDDGWYLNTLPYVDLRGLWSAILTDVPGRNLRSLWQYLIFKLVADPPAHLPALHVLQAAVDGMTAAGFFLLLRLWALPASVSLIAASLFSFWPTHGETHFWLSMTPQNQFSTMFLVLFAATSLLLAGDWRRLWWLWALDATAFACALFTYDQVFFILAGIVALRLGAVLLRRCGGGWRFALVHLPYLAAGAFFVWLKLTMDPSRGPVLHSDAWRRVRGNLLETRSLDVGRLWLKNIAPFYDRVSWIDWLLALLVASGITSVAIWLLLRPPLTPHPAPGRPYLGRLLLLALLFYVAAYWPVWIWYPAQRHHYLPSVGLMAGGAACLAWVFDRLCPQPARVIVILALGGAIFALAAADRGESHFWEDSFTLRKQLFAELKPDLAGKEILVLEDFPSELGPAYFVRLQDACFAPRLLYHGSLPLGPAFTGDIGSSPAPRGLFLQTQTNLHGPESFRFYPTENYLIARFTAWEDGWLRYEKNPARTLPYQVISCRVTPRKGAFQVDRFSARRESEGVVVSWRLAADLHPNCYLTAVFSFLHGGEYYRWGRFDKRHNLFLSPVLLSDPAPHPPSGGHEWEQELRLLSFPQTDRIAVEFFLANRTFPPLRLGRSEAAVEP